MMPLLKQEQKLSLHPFPLTLKGTSQNSGRLFPFFPYQMKITLTPKRLLAQRRRREGVYTPKGTGQPPQAALRPEMGKGMERMVPVQGIEAE